MCKVFLGLEITNRKSPVIKSIIVETVDGKMHELKWEKTEGYMDFIGELEYVLQNVSFDSDADDILKFAKIVYIELDNIQPIEAAGISFETDHDIYFLSSISVLCEATDDIVPKGEKTYAMAI